MLVLTRKTDEAIIIELPNGQQVDIIVSEVKGNQVRIGIDAPRNVIVLREELIAE